MNLPSLNNNSNTVWTLFMLSGYLTPSEYVDFSKLVTLRIPNFEIRKNLENICVNWFKDNIKRGNIFEDYLLNNNMYDFKDTFKMIVEESFSYYDINIKHGENFYHAFVMGLLYSGSNNFIIKSNRESGYGRYDLILKPKNKDIKYAYIIEEILNLRCCCGRADYNKSELSAHVVYYALKHSAAYVYMQLFKKGCYFKRCIKLFCASLTICGFHYS